ncbi:hypothetical protein DBV15_11343 [Temnothorax longispinosus]|uniref:Uncharacterized protein n=1 Tax=Temnothorax longispinosus TaxID=300112 RepID=A0A4S2KSA7_9HYME|nr:hypothetical protein DBV15_11343 [Temnothorax longispinosus]
MQQRPEQCCALQLILKYIKCIKKNVCFSIDISDKDLFATIFFFRILSIKLYQFLFYNAFEEFKIFGIECPFSHLHYCEPVMGGAPGDRVQGEKRRRRRWRRGGVCWRRLECPRTTNGADTTGLPFTAYLPIGDEGIGCMVARDKEVDMQERAEKIENSKACKDYKDVKIGWLPRYSKDGVTEKGRKSLIARMRCGNETRGNMYEWRKCRLCGKENEDMRHISTTCEKVESWKGRMIDMLSDDGAGCVQKVLEQYERIYGSPMPLFEQTKKNTNAFDNTRITYNGNILNNSVFNYTTYQSRPSPSTSTGYNMDLSAERRSEERPDLQVLSSKQTRKRKGAEIVKPTSLPSRFKEGQPSLCITFGSLVYEQTVMSRYEPQGEALCIATGVNPDFQETIAH